MRPHFEMTPVKLLIWQNGELRPKDKSARLDREATTAAKFEPTNSRARARACAKVEFARVWRRRRTLQVVGRTIR